MKPLHLWKYNRVTGYWHIERMVDASTKDQWLEIFQSDAPNEFFKVAVNRPNHNPSK